MDQQEPYQKQTEKVTDPAQILLLLRRLFESRSLLTVKIGENSTQFNSAIIKINSDLQSIVLDEFMPNTGHKLFLSKKTLHAYARNNGVDFHFVAHLKEVNDDDNAALYIVDFPKFIHYQQRRSYYRVQVGRGLSIPISVSHSNNTTILTGKLCDLSQGGVGARLFGDIEEKEGEYLSKCIIQLPNETSIASELEVCFLKHDSHIDETRIGGRFIHLSSPEERAIGKAVTTIERELIRKRK